MVRHALAALACFALVACGASLPHVEPTPSGYTDIVIERHIEAPFEVRRARVALDGAIAYEHMFDGDAPPAILALRAPLAPGEHHVQIELDVIVQCSVAGALRAAYTVHRARVVEVPAGATGSLTFDLHTKGAMRELGDRLQVSTSAGGALQEHPEDSLPGRFRAPERCLNLTPALRAFCRADADVAEARSERDVVRLLCTTEKLREMRALPPDDPKVIALGMEADDCIGVQPGRHQAEANTIDARSTCPDSP